MFDYGSAPFGRTATPEQREAYARNLVCKAASGPLWSAFRGFQAQIHVMRDGLIFAGVSCRSPEIVIETFDWPAVTAIDLRTSPAGLTLAGKVRSAPGITRTGRRAFLDALTEARLRGDIPPHVIIEGGGATRPSRIGKTVETVGGGLVLLALGAAYFGSGGGGACKVEAVTVVPDMFIVRDQPDAGFTVHATVLNTGRQGTITVTAILSTSEGRFTRQQDYVLAGNARQTLDFGFPEPTINATNVQGGVSCRP